MLGYRDPIDLENETTTKVVLNLATKQCHHFSIPGVKRQGSYVAQYPTLRIGQSALHFTPWQTCSIEHHLGFSGKHSAMRQLIRKDYSYTDIHHCL